MQYPLVSDMDRKVFAEELAPRLPKKLFDAHVHVFNKDCFPEGFSLGEKSCYQKFGGEHRSEFCVEMYKKLLPSRTTTTRRSIRWRSCRRWIRRKRLNGGWLTINWSV